MTTANRMKIFGNEANTKLNWKLQVFTAIIRSKLLYGLDTIQLTKQDTQKMMPSK